MKAAVLSGSVNNSTLSIQDVEDPAPGPGQVSVRIHAAALNRRDFWITQGLYPDIRLPCILGSDGAGVIQAVGEGVEPSRIGQEVVIYPVYDWGDDPRIPGPDFRVLGMPDPGTFAEYLCVPVENVFVKPQHMAMHEAAAVSLAGLTAWRALVTKANIKAGEKVLITGIGGGVASLALLWAVGLAAEVYVTSGSEAKIEQAKALGAVAGFNYDDVHWHEHLIDVCGGVDVVIDGNAGPVFQPCFDSLKPAGRYIMFGFTKGNPPQGLDIARLFFKQLKIEGTMMGTPDEYAAMLKFVSDKKIKPVIDRVFDLKDVVAAHEYIHTGAHMGKIIIRTN